MANENLSWKIQSNDSVKDSVQDSVEDTVEEVKDDAKLAAKKLTNSEIYLGSDDNKENRDNLNGGKHPMNPEDIAKREPTTVKR